MDANEHGYQLPNSILRFVNHILNGTFSNWSLEVLFAISLTAICEMDRGIRSTGVGNVLRGIGGNLAVQSAGSRVTKQLRQAQVGFGVVGAADATVHATENKN